MSPKRQARKRTLIKTRLQLKIVGVFLGIGVLPLMLQTLLMGWFLIDVAAGMPDGGEYLSLQVPGLLQKCLLGSLTLLLPLTTWVGILATFRVAGPVYRLESYLRGVARGEEREPCRLRKGDELVELCEAVNAATEPLRRAEVGDAREQPEAA